MPKYFGTDGIRGKSPEWLDINKAYRIGYAIGKEFSPEKVYIGRDTRASGFKLNQGLNQGLIDSGVNPINLGVVSTPMTQYLSLKNNCMGIMITASHNPATDNGIKVLFSGKKSTESQENLIESYLNDENLEASHFSNFTSDERPLVEYLEAIKALGFPKTDIKVHLDTAHGSLSKWAKLILGDYLEVLNVVGNSPDGQNINENVGSTSVNVFKKSLPKGVIGLTFDGDGDRLLAVDEHGELVSGDQIISIVAAQNFDIDKVALTQMVNPGIKRYLNNHGLSVLETGVGDKYIIQAMDDHDIFIGGEDSGHMIFKEYWPIGDGIISALALIKIMHDTRKSLHELKKPISKYPEKLINIKGIKKEDFLSNSELSEKVNHLNEKLDENAKLLIRPSGTEPVIRVYASHKESDKLQQLISECLNLFESYGGYV